METDVMKILMTEPLVITNLRIRSRLKYRVFKEVLDTLLVNEWVSEKLSLSGEGFKFYLTKKGMTYMTDPEEHEREILK